MRTKNSSGFSLVELMMAVAIIGILASTALPAYNDYIIRARILEGISLVGPAKVEIVIGASTEQSLMLIANQWNTQDRYNGTTPTSKYVDSITINNTSGVILIDFNENTIGLSSSADQLTLTPSVITNTGTIVSLATALATGRINQIDWACASSNNTRATSRGLVVTPPDNPLPEKLTPKECR